MESIEIIAIFWPPLAVFIENGFGKHLVKNLLWTLLGFYPGVIHALRFVSPDLKSQNVP